MIARAAKSNALLLRLRDNGALIGKDASIATSKNGIVLTFIWSLGRNLARLSLSGYSRDEVNVALSGWLRGEFEAAP